MLFSFRNMGNFSWFWMLPPVGLFPFHLLPDCPQLLLSVINVPGYLSMSSYSFYFRMTCEFLFQSFVITQSSSFSRFKLKKSLCCLTLYLPNKLIKQLNITKTEALHVLIFLQFIVKCYKTILRAFWELCVNLKESQSLTIPNQANSPDNSTNTI